MELCTVHLLRVCIHVYSFLLALLSLVYTMVLPLCLRQVQFTPWHLEYCIAHTSLGNEVSSPPPPYCNSASHAEADPEGRGAEKRAPSIRPEYPMP